MTDFPALEPQLVGAIRLVAAAILILAGSGKMLEPNAFIELLRLQFNLRGDLARSVAVALSFIEIAIGITLAIGISQSIILALSAALFLVLVIGLLILRLRGRVRIECGCFGKPHRFARKTVHLILLNSLMVCLLVGASLIGHQIPPSQWPQIVAEATIVTALVLTVRLTQGLGETNRIRAEWLASSIRPLASTPRTQSPS